MTGFGCKQLAWESSIMLDKGRRVSVPYHYQVIDLDTIIRSAYVVKDYKLWKDDDERFFLSAFKWQRAQPDLRKYMDIDSESGSESEE